MAQNGQEILFEGWLTKSPPTKRIWRARWRRRWFSLSHSGELPGQFVLSYYTDRNRRKQKGVIDLDHCEQVDLGLKLEERKLKFDHVFDIKTPTRTYYLAADTESEMKSWVDCICKVCNLKATTDEDESHISVTASDDVEVIEEETQSKEVQLVQKNTEKSIPVSPVSTSPYIPISECITGSSPVMDPQDLRTLLAYNIKNSFFRVHMNDAYELPQRHYINYVNDMQDPRFYDCPRPLAPTSHQKNEQEKEKEDPQSPADCDSDSVFADDEEFEHNVSSDLNTSKKSRPSDSSADVDMTVTQKFTKMSIAQDKTSDAAPKAPPRPPKPQNISTHAPNYHNLSSPPLNEKDALESNHRNSQRYIDGKKVITDEMYDFPRSHQVEPETAKGSLARRHCYNNAAPVNADGHIFIYDNSPKANLGPTPAFRYDAEDISRIERSSPHSENNSTPAYSNLPSPLLADTQLMPPPVVNRDLKPRRKLSDSHSHSLYANAEPASPRSQQQQLGMQKKIKSTTPLQDGAMRKVFNMDEDGRKMRPNPSPTLAGRSHDNLLNSPENEEQIYLFLPGGGGGSNNLMKLQYLDLNFDDSENKDSNSTTTIRSRSPVRGTEYKEVDFMKTQAFNITRSNLEKERNEPITYNKKGIDK